MLINNLRDRLEQYEIIVRAEGWTVTQATKALGLSLFSWSRWKRTNKISAFYYQYLIDKGVLRVWNKQQ